MLQDRLLNSAVNPDLHLLFFFTYVKMISYGVVQSSPMSGTTFCEDSVIKIAQDFVTSLTTLIYELQGIRQSFYFFSK